MTTLVVMGLALSILSCGKSGAPTIPGISKAPNRLSEVAPPPTLLELRKVLDVHQPQVAILSPRSDEVLQDTSVAVRLRVDDLPLFKDETLGLGPHLHFILDNQPYEAIYDVNEPILLQDLTPGTHTVRVFASRPWYESFKNEGAYAQTTFHIFTKTPDNHPSSAYPLLTYSRPKGSYGAEPVMLDFYLANAPLHMVAQENATDDIVDWQIRCTINGESFTFDRWEPIYLKGLKPGRNWVQLELLDEQGNPFPNAFNNTVRLIDYQPGGTDTLSQLIRGELSVADALYIVDPNYVPPTPEPEPEPEIAPEPESEPLPDAALEPGDIPEVVPDQTIDAPTVPEAPAAIEAPEPPTLEEERNQLPANLSQPTEAEETDAEEKVGAPDLIPSPMPIPAPRELPQEIKAKEQLVEEVEDQLEELESTSATPASTEAIRDLLIAPESAQTPPDAPIAPLTPLPPPDERAKLFDRAKHFLNQVLPRPTEPDEPSPIAPIAPTTDVPAVTRPEDTIDIEEALSNPTLQDLLEAPDPQQTGF